MIGPALPDSSSVPWSEKVTAAAGRALSWSSLRTTTATTLAIATFSHAVTRNASNVRSRQFVKRSYRHSWRTDIQRV